MSAIRLYLTIDALWEVTNWVAWYLGMSSSLAGPRMIFTVACQTYYTIVNSGLLVTTPWPIKHMLALSTCTVYPMLKAYNVEVSHLRWLWRMHNLVWYAALRWKMVCDSNEADYTAHEKPEKYQAKYRAMLVDLAGVWSSVGTMMGQQLDVFDLANHIEHASDTLATKATQLMKQNQVVLREWNEFWPKYYEAHFFDKAGSPRLKPEGTDIPQENS